MKTAQFCHFVATGFRWVTVLNLANSSLPSSFRHSVDIRTKKYQMANNQVFSIKFIRFQESCGIDIKNWIHWYTQDMWNLNKGRSNLAIGSIASNWGFRLTNLPIQWGDRGPCLIQCYLGPHKWHLILSNDFTWVHKCDRHTYRQTDTPYHSNICPPSLSVMPPKNITSISCIPTSVKEAAV